MCVNFRYTAEAINNFVDNVGVTRRGNDNVHSIRLLENAIRTDLDKKAQRTMAVVDPIKVTLTNFTESNNEEIETHLFPKNKELGSRNIHLTKTIFIERTDFKETEDSNFFGVMPGKEAGLKYAGLIVCKKVIKDNEGKVVELECEYSKDAKKTQGRIHWISDVDAAKVEVRIYDYLFKSDEPMSLEDPLKDLNPNSLVIRNEALVHKDILTSIKPLDHFQFERLGYFAVDLDTNKDIKRYVFNLTVTLGDEKNKKI